MASSKISKTEKKKSKDGESTEAANKPSKARKDKDLEKKKKNKYNEKEKEKVKVKVKVKVKDQKNKKKDNDNNKDKEQKNKKNKLSNGHVKENKILIVPSSSTEEEEEEENTYEEANTEITNGQTTETKPKKGKRKKGDDDDEVAEDSKTHRFPMHRIKTIIRAEDIDSRVSQEAVFVINKATEKFLEQLTQNSYACSVQDRKKSLSYKHLSSVVSKQRRYDFLSDFVPEKVKAEDALGEKNSGGKGGASKL